MAGDTTGMLLALVHRDVVDTQPVQLDCCREPRWSAPDDCNTTLGRCHGATLHPVSVQSSAWQ